jgi:thiamine pyrophosphokinase
MHNGGALDLILAGELAPTTEFANTIVCADSGAEHGRRLRLDVMAIVGDLDSISNETLEHYREKGSEIVRIPEQDHNDFEKSLRYLLSKEMTIVRVFGMTGGRTDHTLTNFSVMLRYTDQFDSLVALDANGEHQFLTAKKNAASINCAVGSAVSLTPFGEAIGVTTTNLKYALLGEQLKLGIREGLSNVATGTPVGVTIESGALLLSVLRSA